MSAEGFRIDTGIAASLALDSYSSVTAAIATRCNVNLAVGSFLTPLSASCRRRHLSPSLTLDCSRETSLPRSLCPSLASPASPILIARSPLAMDKRLFLRNALRQNKPAVGMWLTMPGTALARTIATVPGLNWILIDGEHGLVTDRDFYEVRWRFFWVVLHCKWLTRLVSTPSIRPNPSLSTESSLLPLLNSSTTPSPPAASHPSSASPTPKDG